MRCEGRRANGIERFGIVRSVLGLMALLAGRSQEYGAWQLLKRIEHGASGLVMRLGRHENLCRGQRFASWHPKPY